MVYKYVAVCHFLIVMEQVGDIKAQWFSQVAPKARAVTVIMLLHNNLYLKSQDHGVTMTLRLNFFVLLIK